MSVNKVNSDGSLSRVAGGTLYADAPIGTISPYGGSVIPSGYLLCDGQAVSRTDYADLFAVIGTAFGSGDGSTTFNLPDLRDRAAMGAGTNGALGASQNDTTAANGLSATTSSDGGHSHNVLAYTGEKVSVAYMYPRSIIASNRETTQGSYVYDADFGGTSRPYIQTAGYHVHNVYISSTDSETRPKNVRVNYIIKAKQVAVPADFKDAIDDAIKAENMPTSVTRMSPIAGGFAVFNLPAKATGARIILFDKYGDPAIAGSCNLITSAGFTSETDSMWYASITDINTAFGTAITNGDAIAVKIEITY